MNVINSYVEHYCQYSDNGVTLERFSIDNARVTIAIGYAPSVKEVSVELTMLYGDDEGTYEMGQTLKLENTTGSYLITQAQGPCETIIKHE